MGIVTSTVYQQQYRSMREDIKYKMDLIGQTKVNLTGQITELVNSATDLEPGSPMAKQLQARIEKLHQLEKRLEMQLAAYQAQLKSIDEAEQHVQ